MSFALVIAVSLLALEKGSTQVRARQDAALERANNAAADADAKQKAARQQKVSQANKKAAMNHMAARVHHRQAEMSTRAARSR